MICINNKNRTPISFANIFMLCVIIVSRITLEQNVFIYNT